MNSSIEGEEKTMKLMKKVITLALVFSMFFFGVFQNHNMASAQTNLESVEVTSELKSYLQTEKIDFAETPNQRIFSTIYDDIEYVLTYFITDDTYEAKAYDVNTREELDIQELKEAQIREGKVLPAPDGIESGIVTQRFALPLIPVAGWVLEHLIAMALAASLVTVIVVSKDKIKAELEERLKRKNPTIIYRGGSSTATNHTPRTTDKNGLSYYKTMPKGKFTVTTKEAVDSTKVLKAVLDGGNHVSVKPVKASDMQGWIDSRANADKKSHKFTELLEAISISSNN